MFEKTRTSVKHFVAEHKATIAITTAAITVAVVQQIGLKQHNDFLKEHGLYEQFYTPENSY